MRKSLKSSISFSLHCNLQKIQCSISQWMFQRIYFLCFCHQIVFRRRIFLKIDDSKFSFFANVFAIVFSIFIFTKSVWSSLETLKNVISKVFFFWICVWDKLKKIEKNCCVRLTTINLNEMIDVNDVWKKTVEKEKIWFLKRFEKIKRFEIDIVSFKRFVNENENVVNERVMKSIKLKLTIWSKTKNQIDSLIISRKWRRNEMNH